MKTLCTVQEFGTFYFQFPFFFKISQCTNTTNILVCNKMHLKWTHKVFFHVPWQKNLKWFPRRGDLFITVTFEKKPHSNVVNFLVWAICKKNCTDLKYKKLSCKNEVNSIGKKRLFRMPDMKNPFSNQGRGHKHLPSSFISHLIIKFYLDL